MGTTNHNSNHRSGLNQPATTAPERKRHAGVWLLLTLTGAMFGLLSLAPRMPAYVWNFTPSVPVGLYSISSRAAAKDDLIAIAPEEGVREALNTYGVRSAKQLLLKLLQGVQGDVVCRIGASITINGAAVATARLRSSNGLLLPTWSGCRRLGASEVLVLAPHPGSFDSRYFGPIETNTILGVAHPLLTFSPEGGW